MNTKKFDIHWTATQAEIRHWMQKESERMGDWLDTFVISWTHIGDEEIYRLELSSEREIGQTCASRRAAARLPVWHDSVPCVCQRQHGRVPANH